MLMEPNNTYSLPFKGMSCDEAHKLIIFDNGENPFVPGATQIAEALWIIIVTMAIIVLNLLMIVVLHSKQHSRFLPPQPRLLMISLACTDLAVGTLVTPVTLYPTLYGCWPYGDFLCGLEALLISALFHQSTLSLVIIAIDRYICIVHPLRYSAIVTKKLCMIMILISWLFSFSVYSVIIYPSSTYHFDGRGLMSCEPHYANKPIIILATCFFYFPPVALLLYCYGTIFYEAQRQMKIVEPSAFTVSGNYDFTMQTSHIARLKKKMKIYRSSVTLAVIGFGFLLAVTPWTMTELISSCLEIDVPPRVEFAVTWIAISNSFWNPIIYGMFSNSFREVALDILRQCFKAKKTNI